VRVRKEPEKPVSGETPLVFQYIGAFVCPPYVSQRETIISLTNDIYGAIRPTIMSKPRKLIREPRTSVYQPRISPWEQAYRNLQIPGGCAVGGVEHRTIKVRTSRRQQ
jgi:hypothetical protein